MSIVGTRPPLPNEWEAYELHHRARLACGIIPKEGSSLDEVLDRLGGGFEMHSEVTNVPKGSGLGTSSILSAACVKAVFEFMGIEYTEKDLYAHVLAMEQIMSTGGGWQDQVGGITPGLKYITEYLLNQSITASCINFFTQFPVVIQKFCKAIYIATFQLEAH